MTKKSKTIPSKRWWNFTGEDEAFEAANPDRISRLYFPLANESGLLSAITPTLNGDIKSGQNHFLTVPVSEQDLHNTRSARQFWVYVEGRGPWSATAAKPKESSLSRRSQKELKGGLGFKPLCQVGITSTATSIKCSPPPFTIPFIGATSP